MVADRHRRGSFPCRNVRIVGNVTSGGGIRLQGDPAEDNLIEGNRHEGPGGEIVNRADAVVRDNTGYERP